MNSPRPKRRWYKFSLRTLSLVVLVLSILLGAFGWRLQRARQQAAAVATLRALGGDCVVYDYSSHDRPDGFYYFGKEHGSPLPAFLISWLGEDFFHNAIIVVELYPRSQPSPQEVKQYWAAVTALPQLKALRIRPDWMDRDELGRLRDSSELRDLTLDVPLSNDDLRVVGTLSQLTALDVHGEAYEVDDDGLAQLDGLPRLKNFTLGRSKMTAAGLKHLVEHHPGLEGLDLRNCPIDDRSVVWLGKLSHLERLFLFDTNVTNKGLANLSSLSALRLLDLSGLRITDEGLARLSRLSSLRELDLPGTRITGDGLVHLRNMTELEVLCLAGTRVQSLENLGQKPKLKILSLDGTVVSDADLQYLEQLLALQNVSLNKTKITDAGIARFKLPPRLTAIWLGDTGISDRTLEVLARHPQLELIDVSHTKVTPAGVAAFSKALPKCVVLQVP